MNNPVYILSGVRTAIGKFGGSLAGHSPTQLGATVVREAIRRAAIPAADVDHSVFGTVVPTETKDAFLGRTVAIEGGMSDKSMGLTLNRLCGSGAQAIVTAASQIRLGDSNIAVAGGAEALSRAPFAIRDMRFGHARGDSVLYDWLLNTYEDPFGHGLMGVTAENVAEKYKIGRDRQDAFAVESHRRACAAIDEGRFKEQIIGVEINTKNGTHVFDQDEHIRRGTSLGELAKLRPAYKPGGTVTAGNSSGINDGAAAVVLAGEDEVKRRGLKPMARIVSWGLAGVPPEIMGIGPVHAVPVALEKAGLKIKDIDVFESNEAFAVQTLSVSDGLQLDPERVNPNGGAVALGHPLGATGAILTVKALYELRRTGGRYAVITMCIGGGQGIALIIERMN